MPSAFRRSSSGPASLPLPEKADFLAAGTLILVAFMIFGRALLPGNILSPAGILYSQYPWRVLNEAAPPVNPAFSDMVLQLQAWAVHCAREMRTGRFPLWNPHSYCGSPFLGNMQSGVLSPFNLLSCLLPLPLAFGLAAIGKMSLTGLSMFWFTRLLGFRTFPSFIGGLSFMLSGFVVGWLGWPMGNVAVWLPMLFALTELTRITGRWRHAGLLAGVVCLQFLGGHPETSLYCLTAVCAWAAYRAGRTERTAFLTRFAAALVAGTALAAIQLGPFLEYMFQSVTYSARSHAYTSTAFGFKNIMLFFLPKYFGSPEAGTTWEGPLSTNYAENSLTVGLLPWALLPCAIIAVRKPRGTPFFMGLAAICSLFAFDFPIAPRLLGFLPGFSMAASHRMNLLVDFSLAALAAAGMEAAGSAARNIRGRLAAATGKFIGVLLAFILIIAALDQPAIFRAGAWPSIRLQLAIMALLLGASAFLVRQALKRGRTPAIMLGMVMVQLLSAVPFAASYYPVINVKDFFPSPPSLEFLRNQGGLFRVILPLPNVAAVYGLNEPGGYDAMNPRRLAPLVCRSNPGNRYGNAPLVFDHPYSSSLLDLMNIRYILLPPGIPLPLAKFKRVYDSYDGRIYLNTRTLPRTFLVPRARYYGDESLELADMIAGRVDFREEVVLPKDDAPITGTGGRGAAEIEAYEPDRVTVRTEASGPSFLVMSDCWMNGWSAAIDGRPAKLLLANHAFRAVHLPAGKHLVEFLYRPAPFRIGLVISLAALAVLALMLLF